jgi:hypothetical protein
MEGVIVTSTYFKEISGQTAEHPTLGRAVAVDSTHLIARMNRHLARLAPMLTDPFAPWPDTGRSAGREMNGLQDRSAELDLTPDRPKAAETTAEREHRAEDRANTAEEETTL